jgi:hypothetical protein
MSNPADDRARAEFWRLHQAGLTFDQIQAATGWSLGTIHKYLHLDHPDEMGPVEITCVMCGKKMMAKQQGPSTRRTCSGACRVAAVRARRAAT